MFPIEKFAENGFSVIEDFLTNAEVADLKEEVAKIVSDAAASNEEKVVFSAGARQQLINTEYFLNSNDKISIFYEEDNPQQANKIGHALHTLNESFKRVTFSNKVKDVVKQLDYIDPVIVQSMYIFKNPQIGGKVCPHQDATYLHTLPSINGLGLWIAIDDADEQNGCLQAVIGSHKSGLHNEYQLVRRGGKGKKESKGDEKKEEEKKEEEEKEEEGVEGEEVRLDYKGEEQAYVDEKFVALPVKKGSLVLIDSLFVHSSEQNKSQRPRNAFTLHLYDAYKVTWDPLNWLQASKQGNFVHLYSGEALY